MYVLADTKETLELYEILLPLEGKDNIFLCHSMIIEMNKCLKSDEYVQTSTKPSMLCAMETLLRSS